MLQTRCEISFSGKVRVFSSDLLKCCFYIKQPEVDTSFFTKKLYSELISSSQVLEDFLDFHGAKNNSNWYFYRELSAAVRHLSLGGYSLRHLLNRLDFYDVPDTSSIRTRGEEVHLFLTGSLIKMAPVIIEEAKWLGIAMPESRFMPEDFPGITTSEMLPYDIDDFNRDEQKKNIISIASDLLSIADNFEEFGFVEPLSQQEISEIVPEKVNEVEIRRFEMLIHNLQSSFDTYVIHGGYRYGNRQLKQLRGYFSIVFHLLQIMGRLLHFYERHIFESGYKHTYKRVRDRLSQLVNPEMLLDHTINFGLFHVCRILSRGKELAQKILNEHIEKTRIQVPIPKKLGFHTRPSLLVAKIVKHYGGQVELCVGDDRFDASSVLDIQWAGGKIQKENIEEVVFEGDSRALKDIEVLASVNYGEDTMGKGVPLPRELSYLK